MSRYRYPSAQLPNSHFFIQVVRGKFRREIALRPGAIYTLLGLVPLLGICYIAAAGYLIFHDEMLAQLMRRQAQMQFAYEDRIAALRTQFDLVASRQMLDQDSFEGKVADLALRQARLETRSALLASLAERVGVSAEPSATIPRKSTPDHKTGAEAAPQKPAPQDMDLRRGSGKPSADDSASNDGAGSDTPAMRLARDPDAPTPVRLSVLTNALERVESRQISTLAALQAPTASQVERLRSAFAQAGLSPARMAQKTGLTRGKQEAVGGPFVPVNADAASTAFDRTLARVQNDFIALDVLRRAVQFAPLRKPLTGALEMTSSFGYRSDPFLGRSAMHTGMDFRGEYGKSIHATASGRVVTAGAMGGYGQMVELDHGDGVTTRYGHMSRILVEAGQMVEAGAVIGEIGSTGRSTGNHLHYEVRLEGEAVDPSRYLRAGGLLAGQNVFAATTSLTKPLD